MTLDLRIQTILMILLYFISTAVCSSEQSTGKIITLNTTSPINQLQLKACPNTPNCINSEYAEKTSQTITPLIFSKKQTEQVMTLSKQIIIKMGGEIISEAQDLYLHAIFTSTFFKFVDDFEIRIDIGVDKNTNKLHIRSASRTGYSDFGVNKRRVVKFYALLSQQL